MMEKKRQAQREIYPISELQNCLETPILVLCWRQSPRWLHFYFCLLTKCIGMKDGEGKPIQGAAEATWFVQPGVEWGDLVVDFNIFRRGSWGRHWSFFCGDQWQDFRRSLSQGRFSLGIRKRFYPGGGWALEQHLLEFMKCLDRALRHKV